MMSRLQQSSRWWEAAAGDVGSIRTHYWVYLRGQSRTSAVGTVMK